MAFNAGHVHDPMTRGSGKLNNIGQTVVKFHQSPKWLEFWFNKVQKDNGIIPKVPKVRKGNTPSTFDKGDIPTPKLNIAIHIVGSRGDVQPFIPIAKLLQAPPHGHRVRICTHPAFKDFVEDNGVEFFSIGGDPEALMAYMVKNPGLIPNLESIKAGDIGKRRQGMAEIMEGTWRSCIEAGDGMGEKTTALTVDDVQELFLADAIIANPPSMGHIHCAEKLGIPLHIVFTMPWSPTRVFHHPLAAMEYGDVEVPVANWFSYTMMELLTWQGLGDLINKFRQQTLKLDPVSPLWGHQLISRLRVPHSYLWSQALIPKPADWGPHLSVKGFSFLKLGSNYSPPQDLADFLSAGPPPIYVGFGSIVVQDPQKLTKMIFEAVKLAGVRAIVAKGWGGIGAGEVPKSVFLIGNCPHDWLFQKVSCVVHHGGAGTTAAGIALGVPTVVVPFFGDQPFWGQMVAKAGAGPKPVPFKQMTAETLAASITFALKEEVRIAVQEMASRIGKEDGALGTAQDFEERLRLDDMRCDICPERLATWQDIKTGVHLSGFAAVALVEQRLLLPNRLRLLRHRNWYVYEGAEGPSIGAVAAVSGLFSSIGTNTTDFSRRLQRRPGPGTPQKMIVNNHIRTDETDGQYHNEGLSTEQMENVAWRMATKSHEKDLTRNLEKPARNERLTHVRNKVLVRKVKGGRAYQVTSATAHYAGDLTKTGLKAPVAFFYNVATGFRNLPSYAIHNDSTRRRDEITGFGSGLNVAGKEFVLNVAEAIGGVGRHPYLGAQEEGVTGFGKGIGRGVGGFVCHIFAAVFGIPGYTLKGVEKGLSKRQLTTLQAEFYLIRIRQANHDFQKSTSEERAEVAARWKEIVVT
ncbi:glycosyltransferase family 1 protein [Dothidotthia symphoricarpi CBS 119687]|uniref:Glycosyltransferase family 1 protein n=1 Tax=Dothidotthia symphoricarpi CBS 119687 TaxID=1392245 RepID=A0A6A6ADY5_9PLEO|nr:glycosyltransferase family 1 protein [Dothidotthia symphoricarpi CBS 119687]KAF2129493.1 glycosyltransferase family 1 protein [Dothidotthia symphoricarpi CBS 119687]